MISSVAIALSLICSVTFAENARNPSGSTAAPSQETAQKQLQAIKPTDYFSMFTVAISNSTASIFAPKLGGGSGTGFVIGQAKNAQGEMVLHIFTNRHVIDSAKGSMQNLSVSFLSAGGAAVKAKLAYKSNLNDFAVLEVLLSDVQKLGAPIAPAPLPMGRHEPTPENEGLNKLEIALQRGIVAGIKGEKVHAVGNPLGLTDVVTEGTVSGFQNIDSSMGTVIQTTAAINPGNSGGPLLLELGPGVYVVVGINTAIYPGANLVGFSVPIGPLMQEYIRWSSGHRLAKLKTYVPLTLQNPKMLEHLGYTEKIKKSLPDYDGGPVFMIEQKTKDTPLEENDIVLKVNNQRVYSIYSYKAALSMVDYRNQKTVSMDVLRNGKLVKIDVPLASYEFSEAKADLDFAYIAGFAFQTLPTALEAFVRPDIESRVYVGDIVKSPEMEYAGGLDMIPQGSILNSIEIDGIDYDVRTLLDLKLAMKHITAKSIVVAHYYRLSAPPSDDDENPRAKARPEYASRLSHTRIAGIKRMELYTPKDISLRMIKEKAELDINADADTRDWRTYVNVKREPKKKASCNDLLLGSAS